jgi:hypothetical protein
MARRPEMTVEDCVRRQEPLSLIITGLSTGDKVQWTTSGTHDRVLIENISNADGISGNDNNTFDIGGFSLIQAQPAPDEVLDFAARISDADGDTATSNIFRIGIDGTGVNDDNRLSGSTPDHCPGGEKNDFPPDETEQVTGLANGCNPRDVCRRLWRDLVQARDDPYRAGLIPTLAASDSWVFPDAVRM